MAFLRASPLPSSSRRSQVKAASPRHRSPTCSAGNFSRRAMLSAAAAASAGLFLHPHISQRSASASGLILFPLKEPLYNSYYFVRAGETLNLSPKGPRVARTNPVEKTSIRLHGLSKRGVAQGLEVAAALEEKFGLGPTTWVWYGQHNASNETAHLIAASMRIRNENLVPEFAFLDPRGFGALEGQPVDFAESEIARMDAVNVSWRMPPGEDGTPNESVEDVFVRVRQLLSKLETQYSGEEIVVVAPDSDTLSILEASLRNVPLERHREVCGYSPGEMRKVEPAVVKSQYS